MNSKKKQSLDAFNFEETRNLYIELLKERNDLRER